MLDTRPEVRGFVDDVTARYGSVGEFFAQLRAEVDKPDDEATVELPVVDRRPGPVAWSAADPLEEPPVPESPADMTVPRCATGGFGGRIRHGLAAVWGWLTGR